MSWENLRQTYMSILSDEGFRPEIDPDGDIHFKYEGGHYYINSNCDDGYFYLLFPSFWAIDDVEELGRAVMAANNATRSFKAVKVYIRNDMKNVSATAEGLIASPSDVRKFLDRALRSLRGAVESFMKEMKQGDLETFNCGDCASGGWDSGNPAFAVSRGSCGTAPSASSSGSRFSDMLFSPPAFAFRSIG